MEGKDKLISPSLKVLVLINMGLDWEQMDILSPCFSYLEELHLCRNKCSKICSEYQINPENFKNLTFLNLEENEIADWSEVEGFKTLKNLQKITLSKNYIKSIFYTGDFYSLSCIAVEENFIEHLQSIDNLNQFPQIKNLRIGKNPLTTTKTAEQKSMVKQNIIARIAQLKFLNGTEIKPIERKDAEIVYIRKSYEEFIKLNDNKQALGETDQKLKHFMANVHPRWYELIDKFGSPIEMVSLKQDVAASKMQSNSASLILKCGDKKPLAKKLILSTTIATLKSICSKLFKVEVIKQSLSYQEKGKAFTCELDDNLKQLSFYGVSDGGTIEIKETK